MLFKKTLTEHSEDLTSYWDRINSTRGPKAQATLCVKLGKELLAAQKFSAAEDLFLRARKLRSKDYQAYYQLGELYYRQNKLSAASAALEHSLKLAPDSYMSYDALGLLKISQKDFKGGTGGFA